MIAFSIAYACCFDLSCILLICYSMMSLTLKLVLPPISSLTPHAMLFRMLLIWSLASCSLPLQTAMMLCIRPALSLSSLWSLLLLWFYFNCCRLITPKTLGGIFLVAGLVNTLIMRLSRSTSTCSWSFLMYSMTSSKLSKLCSSFSPSFSDASLAW